MHGKLYTLAQSEAKKKSVSERFESDGKTVANDGINLNT